MSLYMNLLPFVSVSIKKSELINKAKVAGHSEITIFDFSTHGIKKSDLTKGCKHVQETPAAMSIYLFLMTQQTDDECFSFGVEVTTKKVYFS